jgi:hypothetical protein
LHALTSLRTWRSCPLPLLKAVGGQPYSSAVAAAYCAVPLRAAAPYREAAAGVAPGCCWRRCARPSLPVADLYCAVAGVAPYAVAAARITALRCCRCCARRCRRLLRSGTAMAPMAIRTELAAAVAP